MALIDPSPERLLRGAHDRRELARHGVSDHQLRGPGWVRTNQGLWARSLRPAGHGPGPHAVDPWERVLRAAPLTGDVGAIGGWAAAFAHGFHRLDGRAPSGSEFPVPLCLPRTARCRRTTGVRVVRSDLEEGEIMVVGGVRVTSPARTCADLARLTASLVEAVVCVDAMIPDGDALLAEVSRWLDDRPRRRGAVRAREALSLARPHTESAQESRLRMFWVVDAGLPMPLVNRQIYSRTGEFVGRADLIDPDSGVVAEYDGGDHAGADRRSKDHSRRERFEALGLIVVQHTAVDLGGRRAAALARLRRRHADGVARDRTQDRWVVGPAGPRW
jgi:very-short-patch-repair endonuclease